MTRTFHPIGQGAFYTEMFKSSFIAIYDCGGSDKQIIEDEIKTTFEKAQKVHIVFISHLNNDHINGLEFLLKYCDVQKVVLPLLCDTMKLWFVVENAIYNRNKDSRFIDELIMIPEKLLDNKVVFVQPFNDTVLNDNTVDISNLSDQIKSGTILENKNIDWVYVPVNFQYTIYANNLKIELAKIGVSLNNIIGKLQTNKQDIIDIYKKVLGGSKNFNANSMTVYSGTKTNKKLAMVTKQSNKFVMNEKVGCMYLGDFEAIKQDKFNSLKNVYARYWNQISTVQIPHHGSKHNFHKDLAWSDSISVISTGYRHKHPSANVLKEIAKKNSFLGLVTKQKDTKIIQCIKNCKIQSLACLSVEFEIFLKDKYPECFL